MQNAWFRKSRFKGGKGKKLNIGGGGLGYRERPGLGSENMDRGNNNVMSNYEAYKPSTGAMGDRLTAMKAAFQSQYKSHFVAASLSNQKAGSAAAGASGWTSAGSLNSVPTNSAQQGHNSPDSPVAGATKGIPGFGNTGNISGAPVTYPSAGAQGVNNTASGNNSREGTGVATGKERDMRTGAAAVTVTERLAIGIAIAHVMEMVVAMEMDTATQKAAAVTLMAIGTERTDMEEAQAGMGRTGVQMTVGMGKAGKKLVIVRARWSPRWNPKWTAARWTRWTARQIRQLMALLSQSR